MPRFEKKGQKTVFVKPPPRLMSEIEAKYIVMLDIWFTPSEITRMLLDKSDYTGGLHLVEMAEKRLGKNYTPPELNKNIDEEEQQKDKQEDDQATKE